MWLTRRFFLNFLSIDVRLCLTGWGVGGANHVAKLLRHHLAPCSGNAALKAAGICWQALRAEAGKRQIGGWRVEEWGEENPNLTLLPPAQSPAGDGSG